jgi:hypothetical protein
MKKNIYIVLFMIFVTVGAFLNAATLNSDQMPDFFLPQLKVIFQYADTILYLCLGLVIFGILKQKRYLKKWPLLIGLLIGTDCGLKTYVSLKKISFDNEFNLQLTQPGLPFDLRWINPYWPQSDLSVSPLHGNKWLYERLALLVGVSSERSRVETWQTETSKTPITYDAENPPPHLQSGSYEKHFFSCELKPADVSFQVLLRENFPPPENDYPVKDALFSLGKIIRGPCVNGELFRYEFDTSGPDKSSGDYPVYLIDKKMQSLKPSMPDPLQRRFSYFIVLNEKLILLSENFGDEEKNVFDVLKTWRYDPNVQMEQQTLSILKNAQNQLDKNRYLNFNHLPEYQNLEFLIDHQSEVLSFLELAEQNYPFKVLRPLGYLSSLPKGASSQAPYVFKFILLHPLNDGLWVIYETDLEQAVKDYNFVGFNEDMENPFLLKTRDQELLVDQQSVYLDHLFKIYQDYILEYNSVVTKHNQHADIKLPPKTAMKIVDFKNDLPVIIKKDQLGRHQIYFKAYEGYPYFAEPLIYVYTDTPTPFKISLPPQVENLRTIPLINETMNASSTFERSWQFIAHPIGKITFKADPKIYPSLFWEAHVGIVLPPAFYYQVNPQDLNTFLYMELWSRGLRRKEISDFIKFWSKELRQKKHFYIGFHHQSYIDQIAPLSINPNPQQLLRIHIESRDFQTLDRPFRHWGVISRTPIQQVRMRNGNRVVEWGGFFR